MRFGLNFPLAGIFSNLRVTTELAREADASGWDGFFVWDHILIDGAHSVADPWLALALIADATSRLVIGPLVTPLYRRHPAKLAQEAVTLDHLSNGRLILGAGLGSDEFNEISVFGGPLDDVVRAQLLDEGLAILSGLWTGKRFSFDGDHYHIHDAQMAASLQSPRIPLWIAASWPRKRPMRRAARFEGVVAVRGDMRSSLPPEAISEMVTYIRGLRVSNDSFEVVHFGQIADLRANEAGDYVASYAAVGVTWIVETMPFAIGSLDQVRARIRRGPPTNSWVSNTG
jgi:alkanesulfonate monooxygenase SsuD/methylene tetrahydromethanopterin reductase-like flavin-dependent oxidoreductase (luciferase family)